MKTTLKRGYEWEYLEDKDMVDITVWLKNNVLGEPPEIPESVRIDKVGIYSLAAFLLRTLRRKHSKKIIKTKGVTRT